MEQDKEIQFKFQMFEQQIMAVQQQLQSVEQALVDMIELNLGLDDVEKDKEILAPIGRGIFVNAKTLSEELIVDIGGKNFVKKSIPDTKKLIKEQLEKLEKAREELNGELDKINQDLTKTMVEAQGKN